MAALPPGARCLCDTCNNGNAEPCMGNADCPDPAGPVGPICGGRRCLAGGNAGAPCANATECPASTCERPGERTLPSGCFVDDCSTPFPMGCVDTAPIDGEGECAQGPLQRFCSAASGHGQRFCWTDDDCGGTPDSCVESNRPCFLTGPFFNGAGGMGTGTLSAAGVAETPIADVFSPTLAAVYCSGAAKPLPDIAFGLPGPTRETQRGPATFLP